MIFHIAICDADTALCARVQRLCQEFFARRPDRCEIERFTGADTLLCQDGEGKRYELYLIGLDGSPKPEGLATAAALRARGRKGALAFLARSCAHAYRAYRVDAMQYFLCPVREEDLFALLERAVEPEYGPAMPVPTAEGIRSVPFARIEYVECTHHIVHFYLTDGREVQSLSQRVPFARAAAPLLADPRFLQPHRSYIVNMAEARLLAAGEFRMESGARIPIPREREKDVHAAYLAWLEASGKMPARAVTPQPSSAGTNL